MSLQRAPGALGPLLGCSRSIMREEIVMSGDLQRTIGPVWAFTVALGAASSGAAQVVINEVDYDQPSTDRAEFVELYNAGPTSIELSGYTLELINGANGGATPYKSISLPSATLAPGAFFVICGDASMVSACDLDVSPDSNLIQNGAPDGMQLLLQGAVVDALSYEGDVPGVVEGAGAAADTAASGEGLSRCPDGVDTDNNAVDYSLRPTTPGAANDCPGTGGPTLGQCGDLATPIHAVQGAGSASPMLFATVELEGIVVGDFQDAQIAGYFLQTASGDEDADPLTSEGIFVYSGGGGELVAVGERVRVAGQVGEYSSLTELSNVTSVLHCGAEAVPDATSLQFPVPSMEALEALEGMRVAVTQTMTVTGNYELGRYGSLDLATERLYIPTQVAAPGAAAALIADLNGRSRIIVDDASTVQNPDPIPYLDADGTRRAGDTVTGLEGIVSGRFGTYRIQPTVPVAFDRVNPRPAALEDVGGDVRVASFNVLNFFDTLDDGSAQCGPQGGMGCRGADSAAELTRQTDKLVNALVSLDADIVALMELENDGGPALQMLVDALNTRLGTLAYAGLQTGSVGSDAIRVGFLYNATRVTPVGGFAVLDGAVDARFLDQKNRPSIAQTFEPVSGGLALTVVANHLKSKGSACDDVGDPDVGDGQGNCNLTRLAAAEALVDWLDTDPTGSGSALFLVMGDFNAYAMEDPVTAMTAAGYESLQAAFEGPKAYSYVFKGESGTLDQAFASEGLSPRVTGVTEWHINADEPAVLDYNLEYKTQDPYNGSDPYRASDHDPLLVGVDLTIDRRCDKKKTPPGFARRNHRAQERCEARCKR